MWSMKVAISCASIQVSVCVLQTDLWKLILMCVCVCYSKTETTKNNLLV